MPRLTEVAHRILQEVLKPGDLAIDATAGNGHDSRFLADCVGPTGHVIAIDIQEQVCQRLRETMPSHVEIVHADHAHIQISNGTLQKQPKAIAFNLGYLPGGDKTVCTQPASTMDAVRACLGWLEAGGVMTILAYRGHATGRIEAVLLEAFLKELRGEFTMERHDSVPGERPGPVLWAIRKREES
jgi:predicted methyltransferase